MRTQTSMNWTLLLLRTMSVMDLPSNGLQVLLVSRLTLKGCQVFLAFALRMCCYICPLKFVLILIIEVKPRTNLPMIWTSLLLRVLSSMFNGFLLSSAQFLIGCLFRDSALPVPKELYSNHVHQGTPEAKRPSSPKLYMSVIILCPLWYPVTETRNFSPIELSDDEYPVLPPSLSQPKDHHKPFLLRSPETPSRQLQYVFFFSPVTLH